MQAADGVRGAQECRGLGEVYERQVRAVGHARKSVLRAARRALHAVCGALRLEVECVLRGVRCVLRAACRALRMASVGPRTVLLVGCCALTRAPRIWLLYTHDAPAA